MISEDIAYNAQIIEALRSYHVTGKLDSKALKGVVETTKGVVEIEYGFKGKPFGKIEMTRGQFEVKRATKKNVFVDIKYNHTGTHMKAQDYMTALKCDDLSSDQSLSSAIIMLTVECCRSRMVQAAMNELMKGEKSFDHDVWAGLVHARSTYNHTAASLKIPIVAGDEKWRPLEVMDYISFIKEPDFKGDKEKLTEQIKAVGKYIG